MKWEVKTCLTAVSSSIFVSKNKKEEEIKIKKKKIKNTHPFGKNINLAHTKNKEVLHRYKKKKTYSRFEAGFLTPEFEKDDVTRRSSHG